MKKYFLFIWLITLPVFAIGLDKLEWKKPRVGLTPSNLELAGKVTVVDFWASWCSTCMGKLPLLNSLREKYKDHFRFVAINAGESEETLNKLQGKVDKGIFPWADGFRLFMTNYEFYRDPFREVSKNFFKVEQLPHVLIYNSKGELLHKLSNEEDFKTLEAKLEALK